MMVDGWVNRLQARVFHIWVSVTLVGIPKFSGDSRIIIVYPMKNWVI